MITWQKIECTKCGFTTNCLLNYRAISIASQHETENGYGEHECSITEVPLVDPDPFEGC